MLDGLAWFITVLLAPILLLVYILVWITLALCKLFDDPGIDNTEFFEACARERAAHCVASEATTPAADRQPRRIRIQDVA